MKKILWIWFGVFFFTVMNFSYSEDNKIRLGEIVVTPYDFGIEETVNSFSLDVIDPQKEIGKGTLSLSRALRNNPSIASVTSSNYGGGTSIFIRGADSDHTQFILDDLLVYDPMVTSAYYYGYNYFSLANMNKIEIAKGPFSSLYGSGSIGGTIRAFTRKGSGKPSFSFFQKAGSYNTYQEILSSKGEIKNFAYSFAVDRTDSGGFSSAKEKNGNHERDPYNNLNSSLRLDYSPIEGFNLTLINHYIHTKYEYDKSWPSVSDDDDNYAHYYQGNTELKLAQDLNESLSYKLVLGYSKIYRKGWEDASTDYWYKGNTKQLKWEGKYKFNSFYTLVAGFDYLKERGEDFWKPSYTPKHTSITRGSYLENILTPFKNFLFSGSFRTERHSRYGQHNTFSLSSSYLIEKTRTKIKTSFGEGFKSPSLYQLYDSSSGNLNLNPEDSQSWEAGFNQALGNKLTFGLTYFRTHVKNLIDWVSTGGWTGKYKNVGKAKIHGIENFINYKLSDNTGLKLSFTHLKAWNETANTRLLRRPNNKLSLSIESKIKKLSAFFDVSYVGNRTDSGASILKPYMLANLSFNYRLADSKEVFLRIENVLDKSYEEVKGYQTPRCSFYGGFKINW